jgi:hypothetical protein
MLIKHIVTWWNYIRIILKLQNFFHIAHDVLFCWQILYIGIRDQVHYLAIISRTLNNTVSSTEFRLRRFGVKFRKGSSFFYVCNREGLWYYQLLSSVIIFSLRRPIKKDSVALFR